MFPQAWRISIPSQPRTETNSENQTENDGDTTVLLFLIIIAVTYLDSHWLARLN